VLIDDMGFGQSSAFWRAYPNADRGTPGQGVNGMEAVERDTYDIEFERIK
jgi:hypothetical protein